MIYTDGNRICGDTKNELFKFIRSVGMHSDWFINKNDHGYFEIFGNMRRLVLRSGVQLLNKPDFLLQAKRMYQNSEIGATAVPAQPVNELQPTIKYQNWDKPENRRKNG